MFYVVMPNARSLTLRCLLAATLAWLGPAILAPTPGVAEPGGGSPNAPRILAPHDGDAINTRSTRVSFTTELGTSTRCSTDGGDWLFCSSPYTTPPLADGPHSVAVEARNSQGDTATAVVNFIVDTTRPIVSISGNPANGEFTSHLTASFELGANEPASLQCALDSWDFTPCSSPFLTELAGPADGEHQFAVRAVDLAGNYSLLALREWTVDTVAPDAPVVTDPIESSAVQAAKPYLRGTGEPFARISLAADGLPAGSTTVAANGTWSLATTRHLGDANHVFVAEAVDRAGNLSPPSAAVTVRIDAAIPTGTIESRPAPLSNRSSATFNFTADEQSSFECGVDGSLPHACTPPVFVSGLADGIHTFSLVAIDVSGNRSPAVTHEWWIDTTGPVLTVTSNAPPPLASPTFSFTANEPISSYRCRIDGQGALSPCSSPFVVPALPIGPHRFELRAVDLLGNQTIRMTDFAVTPLPQSPPLPAPPAPPAPGPATTCTPPTGQIGIPATATLGSLRKAARGLRVSVVIDRDALVEIRLLRGQTRLGAVTMPLKRGKRTLTLAVRANRLRSSALKLELVALTPSGGRSSLAGAVVRSAGGRLAIEGAGQGLSSDLACIRTKRARTASYSQRIAATSLAAAGALNIRVKPKVWMLADIQVGQSAVVSRRTVFLRPGRWTRVVMRPSKGAAFAPGRASVQLLTTGIDGAWRTRKSVIALR